MSAPPVPKRQPQDTHGLILQTALQLFTERGFFNTSVQSLARASGLSIGSIYHHFADKQDIARALHRSLHERVVQEIEALDAGHATTHDRCRAVVAFLFDLTEREPAAMAFMLYAKHREFLPDVAPVCSSRPIELMRDLLHAGMASGEVRRCDPVVASAVVFGGPLRLIAARLDGVLPRPLPDYLDETWTCAWQAVATT